MVSNSALIRPPVTVELRSEPGEPLERSVVEFDRQIRFENAFRVFQASDNVVVDIEIRRGVVDLLLEALEGIRFGHIDNFNRGEFKRYRSAFAPTDRQGIWPVPTVF